MNNKIAYKKLYQPIPDLQLFRLLDSPQQLLQDCLLRNFKLIKQYSINSVQQIKMTQFQKSIIPKKVQQLADYIKQRQKEMCKQKEKLFRFSKQKYKLNSNCNYVKRREYHRKQLSSPLHYNSLTKDSLTNSHQKELEVQRWDVKQNIDYTNYQTIEFKNQNLKQQSKTETLKKDPIKTQDKKIKYFDIIKQGNDWVLASINNYNDTFLLNKNNKRANVMSCSEIRQKIMKTNKMKNYFNQTKRLRMSYSGKKSITSLNAKRKENFLLCDMFQIRLSQNHQVIVSVPIQQKSYRNEASLEICSLANKQKFNSIYNLEQKNTNFQKESLKTTIQSEMQINKKSFHLQKLQEIKKDQNLIGTKQQNKKLLTFRKRKQLKNLTERLFPAKLLK